MLKYKDKIFKNRKEAKAFLGGTYKYNYHFYNGDIEFINDFEIASNESTKNIGSR